MGGHLRLTPQSQMYLFVSIGTFEIDWLVSNVPCQSHLSPRFSQMSPFFWDI